MPLPLGQPRRRRVVQQQTEAKTCDSVGLRRDVVPHIEGQQGIHLPLVVESGGQLLQHVGVGVHQPGSRPVFGIRNHSGSVTAAATLHDERLVQGANDLSPPHLPEGLLMHGPVEFSRVGAILEIEGLNAVGALVVPVGPDAPKHFDGGDTVAVRGVMIVDHAQQLDGQSFGELAECRQVYFKIAASQSQDIHQLLPDPGADIQSIEVTADQVFRDPGGNQEGPAAATLHLQGHHTDFPDEIGQQGVLLPGLTGRENRAHASKIQFDSVEIVVSRDLLHFAEDIVTHTLDGIVPQPVGIPGRV